MGIFVDAEGLLHAGDAHTQLTWMDAQVDGQPVTPRHGCPVEVNALWYNTLAFADSLAKTGAAGVRMLHQHESRAVVGVWDEMVEDERGLKVRGRIHDWSGEARYAQALTRAGALDGLSIGFRAAKARRDGRLRVLSAVELWEVSLVTFPMLPGARFREEAQSEA